MTEPGRISPSAYRYRPEDLSGPGTERADTLLVAGGVYGNPYAAVAISERATAEPGDATMVFNGDAHYLDADVATFAAVAGVIGRHRRTLGNVEYALAGGNEQVGCGCAYPGYIPDVVVGRSNEVVARLRGVAGDQPQLTELPRWLVIEVGSCRVGVVHGDLSSVAGWELALENLDPPDADARRAGWSGTPMTRTLLARLLERARLDVLCCTHTGLAYAQRVGDRAVVNNGMAGLPCFAGRLHGVATRVSVHDDAPADSLYGARVGAVRVDAVPVGYDHAAWRETFERIWPRGSAGHRGYAHRLLRGPSHTIERAAREGFAVY